MKSKKIPKDIARLAEAIYGEVLPKQVLPFVCTVMSVGKDRNGLAFVSVDADNTGYGSSWEEWAYELALHALINGRKLLVISNGDPVGANLLSVTLLKEKV